MEIQELIFFYLHENSKTIEIQFRLSIDSEDEFRTAFIDIEESVDFGYELITEDVDLYEEDEEDDLYWFDSPNIDEDNLISFLNEYYVVFPDKMPKIESV